MSTLVGVGFSQLDNPVAAGREAAQQALEPLGKQQPDLVFLLISAGIEEQQALAVLAEVREVTGKARLLGGVNSGIIVSQGAFTSGIAVLALQSDEMRMATGIAKSYNRNSAVAGARLVRQLRAQHETTQQNGNELFFTLLTNSGGGDVVTAMVESMGNELGPLSHLAGGAIYDTTQQVTRSTFLDDESFEDSAVAALIFSPGPMAVKGRHGYRPLGRPLVVTRAEGDVVYELGGRPAFEAYVEQFPDATELTIENFGLFAANHPLGIPQMGREYIIRDPWRARTDGALLTSGVVPQNSVVRIMDGNQRVLIQAAKEAATEAKFLLKGRRPLLALVFSCISRLEYLGEAAQDEVAVLREVIGADVPLIGIFSFGEIGAQSDGPPTIHNKTVVIGIIGEP